MSKPIVGIEVDAGNNTVLLWDVDGRCIKEPLVPWHVGTMKPVRAKTVKLGGASGLNLLYLYGSYENYQIYSKKFSYKYSFKLNDLTQQFLVMNPQYKLFQDMHYSQLKRFVFDIETTGLNYVTDSIILIGVKCSLGEFVLKGSEIEILNQLNELIQLDDPDTIEGYNIFGFDLPFLMSKAKQNRMQLLWGRLNKPVWEGRELDYRIGSFSRPVQTYTCYGRHFVDGLLVAQRYDSINGNSFDSFSLKYLEERFKIAPPDRVIIDRTKVTEYSDEVLTKYVLDDVQGTHKLIEIMVQPEYYLTSMIPAKFQDVLLMGGATRINLVLINEYIQQRHSLPIYNEATNEGYQGGQVDVRDVGVFHNVAKIDVASLYPSIMLNTDAVPQNDPLGAFRSTLKTFTTKRLAYKSQAKTLTGAEQTRYNGMQMALKIFINSYYGYLASGMTFSDQEAAARVTEFGRKIVTDMADQVEGLGYYVIEVDTDGVYFQYPDYLKEEVRRIPESLNLPEWVTVEVESFFETMLSVKMKNYVLKNGEHLEYHGNSLRSRRDEKFAKWFIRDVVERLFAGEYDQIVDLYKSYQHKFINQEFSPEMFAKKERITDKTFESPAKRKLKAVVEQTDLVEGDYIEIYQNDKGEYALIENINFDEDIFYYLNRLYAVAQRFEPVFRKLCIPIAKMTKREYKGLISGQKRILSEYSA